MYFESIFVLVQAIDEWKRVFLKDLFTVDTSETFFFTNTGTMIYALCFRAFINNDMRWE